jgi:hypothetical protein
MVRKQVLLFAVLALLLVAVPAFANDHGCSLARLDGLYIFRASGFITPPGAAPIPKAINELIRFNGDGTASVPGVTVSIGGAITALPVGDPGHYTVADLVPPDGVCSGTLAFGTGGPAFNLVFPLHAGRIWLIQTNPNNVFEGTATKLAR